MPADRTLGEGVTLSDFQSWKHHPVSKVVLAYFRDYAAMMERDVLARWKGGGALLADEKETRGRVLQLNEIDELEFASIRRFYTADSETENGS